jgi:hypothetical protein
MKKILFIDIETSPNLAYTWEKYETDVISFVKERYLLSFAYKWLGQKTVRCHSLYEMKDRELVTKLHELFNEAEIIVGHNSDNFDIRMANAFFAYFNLLPPKPYRTIDTCKIARNKFRFNSNKLNDLADYLKIGHKVETGGFKLWLGCIANNPKSWRKMKLYNKHDVELLEKVYTRLVPWSQNSININILEGILCPSCGSDQMQARGWNMNTKYRTRRYQCQLCGHWSQYGKEKVRDIVCVN